jgi:hypothetical protein
MTFYEFINAGNDRGQGNRMYDLKTYGSLPAERIKPFTFTVTCTSTFTMPEGNT